MAVDAGYTYTGLTPGEEYTLVVVLKRLPESPAVAATAEGLVFGNPVSTIGVWTHTRVVFTAVAGTQRVGISRLAGETNAGRVLIGGMSLVAGVYLGDYFPTISRLRDYSFVSGRDTPSREIIGISSPSTLVSEPFDGVSDAVTLSLDLRSELGAQVAVKILAAEDNALLAQSTLTLTPDWARYVIPSRYGRRVRIQIDGSGSYDVDKVLLEGGSLSLPYFDGADDGGEDYETRWLGLPHRSASRRSWLGEYVTERKDSAWRPFFTVLSGEARGIRLDTTQYTPIDPDVCVEEYERHFHDVSAIAGPTPIRDVPLKGGAAREVEFFLNAESPFAYGAIKPVLENPASALPTASFTDTVVATAVADPLIDPDCPPLPAPPRPPIIMDSCVDVPLSGWTRHWISIPQTAVSAWAKTVPVLTLTTESEEVRQVRVRFHPNPFDYPADRVDPNSYCSEFIVSYLPPQTVLTMDGRLERATAEVAGQPAVPASHLLYGTGGVPMTWPELSCGIAYVMTIDTPITQTDNLTVELALARRE